MKAAARRLNVPPVVAAADRTRGEGVEDRPEADGEGDGQRLSGLPRVHHAGAGRRGSKLPVDKAGDTAELSRLCNGKNSALDIKKALDAQAQGGTADLQHVMNYLEILKAAGLVEIPEPPPVKAGKAGEEVARGCGRADLLARRPDLRTARRAPSSMSAERAGLVPAEAAAAKAEADDPHRSTRRTPINSAHAA